MGYFIGNSNQLLGYYEGDRVALGDIETTQRPALGYVWVNNGWQQTKDSSNDSVLKQIVALEAMITQRMLREAAAGTPYSQAGATKPVGYVELCAQIVKLRGQLVP